MGDSRGFLLKPAPNLRPGRFPRDVRGAAAVEFALLCPVMAGLLALGLLAGEGFEINRKLTMSVRTLADLASQQTEVGAASTTYTYSQILGAAACVMAPYATENSTGGNCSASQLTMTLSEVSTTGSGSGTVVWSETTTGGTALTVGSSVTVPSNITTSGTTVYLILGQAQYTYNPLNFYYQSSAITLSDSLFLSPRQIPSGQTQPQVNCTGC